MLTTTAMGAGGLLASAAFGRADPAPFWPDTDHDQPTLPDYSFVGFHSPRLQKYVDPLPILPRRPLGGQIIAAEHEHQFHRDMLPARSWGFDGASHLGPVIEVERGDDTVTTFVNGLGHHILAEYIDHRVHGARKEHAHHPPLVIHLHGAPNRPVDDGYPTSCMAPGQSVNYCFANELEATSLWYHDHSMGLTRLNVYAGLAAPYWIRDEFDTGAEENPLGLPAGEHEVPLVISDKVFYRNGGMRYNSVRTPIFERLWGGGLAGDVIVVNGKAWPKLMVDRGVYRFRIVQASQLNDYRISFSNRMPFWVIGSDGGLLDEPVLVGALDMAAGERYDILVDFSGFAPGDAVEMINLMQISLFGQMPGGAAVREVMEFEATDKPGRYTSIPDTLRGTAGKPPALPPLSQPSEVSNHTLNSSLYTKGLLMSWIMMNIDNLMFDSPDVDEAPQGTVQMWNLINADATIQVHAIHLHLIQFRVIGRQNYDHPRYAVEQGMHIRVGKRWAPSAEDYVSGPLQPPAPYETGWKDTVRCPRGQITRILVRWPTAQELGFDPDAIFNGPDGSALRGYVWHCHMLDHEDHEMMRQLRVIDPAAPDQSMPDTNGGHHRHHH
ncbi:multicopper oxidase family protein [Mycobacterium sp. DL440]|uniref:multicopper oxidase family protein n=1 Tax=Mycobacterium sp. DL440 TaxID=2675523 RepID=UPI00141FEAAE|nr:multicopper oxidase domain-containing protein [Mycobacterium sp. DL440]